MSQNLQFRPTCTIDVDIVTDDEYVYIYIYIYIYIITISFSSLQSFVVFWKDKVPPFHLMKMMS